MSPPSTRSELASTVSRIAATTSATRQAMPSSAARATFTRVVPPCIPAITARASGFHQGAPSPARPGSTRAPPLSSAARASSVSAAGFSAIPSSRHIHSSIAPAANTPPSIAYSMRPSMRQATVGSSPPDGSGTWSPTWPSTKTPVP